jgi:phosphopentomutase
MARALIIVVDGFGIGAAPDADLFGDTGANTFAHITRTWQAKTGELLDLPNLVGMGLTAACNSVSDEPVDTKTSEPTGGAYAAAMEISSGKDTPSGHWEMTGVPVLFDWGYYPDVPDCFPAEFLEKLISETGVPGFLGCCHASGTDIIRDLGAAHLSSGKPICYTSADSVFQVAAHEQAFGLDRLYAFCETARSLLYEANIGRVIARPFIGDVGNFERTGNRRDYSVEPPAPTLLDLMLQEGKRVCGIGKISDIFAHRGITTSTKATGLEALLDETIAHLEREDEDTLIFTNLVNFDQDFGHRRNPVGYAEALQYFDGRLEEIKRKLRPDDLLLITSDHGCDPTWQGTDHTREYVPLLAWQHDMPVINLGTRNTFSDLGATVGEFFHMPPLENGQSFLPELRNTI